MGSACAEYQCTVPYVRYRTLRGGRGDCQGSRAGVSAVSAGMTSPLRRRRLSREERREQLLDALLQLIAADGFTGLSMEGIARAGDVAKTVVYNTFGNVDSALQMLVSRERERAVSAVAAAMPDFPLPADPQSMFVDTLARILDDVRARPDSWRLILLPADIAPPAVRASIEDHRLGLVERLTPLLDWATPRYGVPDLDIELLAHTAVAAAEHAAQLTLTYPDQFTTERIVAFVNDMLTIAAGAERGASS